MTMDVPEFDCGELPSFYGGQAAEGRNASIELQDGLKHVRISETKRMLHLLHVSNAAKHLDGLPTPGETYHCIMKGNFNGWDLVPATLRLSEPATIKRLDVATLGFNNANIKELCDLIDQKQIGDVSFLCSCYFRDSSKAEYGLLQEQLVKRGGRAAAVRSHAKILLMEMSNGANYVIESSANLRSCRNVEQFSMCDDRELLEFHRGWITELIEGANDG